MKASEKEIEYHSFITTKNDIALAKLFEEYGPEITRSLRKWYTKIALTDDVFILEAVNEAFWGYYRNPQTFDPNKNTLFRFLEVAAERDLKNIIEREQKHQLNKNIAKNVELNENFWNSIKRCNVSPDDRLQEKEVLERIDKELSKYFNNSLDIAIAKLILKGERETKLFTNMLGIETLPEEDQRKEVKRQKGRIKAVLVRHDIEAKLKRLIL